MIKGLFLSLAIFLLIGTSYAFGNVVWMDGKAGSIPKGKLLTPNPDYWGENISTGVTYEYKSALEGTVDTQSDEQQFVGRRLFDGIEFGYAFWGKGPTLKTPGTIVLDFKRVCKFTEADLLTENKAVSIGIEVSNDNANWKSVYKSEKPETITFHRLPLKASGRYMRIGLEAENTISLAEIWVWGDAKVSEAEYKERGLASKLDLNSRAGIIGAKNTAVTDEAYRAWSKALRNAKLDSQKIVITTTAPWRSLAMSPVLPTADRIGKPTRLTVCKNETEPAALYVTNTSGKSVRSTKVQLSAFRDKSGRVCRDITGELFTFAIMTSKAFDPSPYALISKANKPGRDMLRRYCLNAASIEDFPTLHLSPAGSAIVWAKIKTNNCRPGNYTAQMIASGADPVDINVTVIDVTLPNPKLWINYWSGDMNMSPFRPADWQHKEALMRNELGMRVIEGWPENGSTPQALYKVNNQTIFRIWGMGEYGYKLWAVGHMGVKYGIEDITPADRENLKAIVRAHSDAAKKFNLDYSQWYLDTADEPNPRNMKLFSEFVKIAKEADPKAMIFMNPCGWLGLPDKVVEDDSTMYPAMQGWYEKYIDISVPGFLNLVDAPNSYKLYTAPRAFNAMYDVMGSKTRSDKEHGLTNYPRYLSWLAARHGFNGYAYYSLYQPRMNPWDDFDAPEGDYLTILPGPNGPVITRGSEATREAYEDFLMLSLIKSRDINAYNDLIRHWNIFGMYDDLREKAIKILSVN